MPLHTNHIDFLTSLFIATFEESHKPMFVQWVNGDAKSFLTDCRHMLQAVRYNAIAKDDMIYISEFATRHPTVVYFHLLREDDYSLSYEKDLRNAIAVITKASNRDGSINRANIDKSSIASGIDAESLIPRIEKIQKSLIALNKALDAEDQQKSLAYFYKNKENRSILSSISFTVNNDEKQQRPFITNRFNLLRQIITGEAFLSDLNPYTKINYSENGTAVYSQLDVPDGYNPGNKEVRNFMADLIEYTAFAMKAYSEGELKIKVPFDDYIIQQAHNLTFNLIKEYYTVGDLTRRLGGAIPKETNETVKNALSKAKDDAKVSEILSDEQIKSLEPIMNRYFDKDVDAQIITQSKDDSDIPLLMLMDTVIQPSKSRNVPPPSSCCVIS